MDDDFELITGHRPTEKLDSKAIAFGLVVNLKRDIQGLPAFRGQTQLVRSIAKLTELALWKK